MKRTVAILIALLLLSVRCTCVTPGGKYAVLVMDHPNEFYTSVPDAGRTIWPVIIRVARLHPELRDGGSRPRVPGD